MRIERISIDRVNPAAYNPRKDLKPDDPQYEQLRRSIAMFDAVEPLVWNQRTGNLVGGHQRLKVLKERGDSDVDVSVVDLDDAHEKALNIALNKISGEWDIPKLKALLVDLDSGEFDLEITGFTEAELKDLIDFTPKMRDEDKIPAVPENPVTKQGDVWLLGDHVLICGDCRDVELINKSTENRRFNLVVTSPPYAAQRKYDESSGFKPILPEAYVEWFSDIQDSIRRVITDDGSYFLNIKEHCAEGERHLYVKDLLIAHVREWGWRFVDEFAWVHGGTPKAVVNRFKNGWEPIFQFTRYAKFKFRPDEVRHASDDIPDWGGKHPSQGDGLAMHKGQGIGGTQGSGLPRGGIFNGIDPGVVGGLAYPSNVLSLGKNREALGHGAAYPVALPEFFIKAYTDEGDSVFDPFMGSGSTLIACEKHNRMGVGTEISPGYCDVIVKRWENFTGQKAMLLNIEKTETLCLNQATS